MLGLLCTRAQQSRGLNLAGNNHVYQRRLGAELLERSSAEMHLGILVDNRLAVSQRCAPSAQKVNGILEYVKKSVGSRAREVSLRLSWP